MAKTGQERVLRRTPLDLDLDNVPPVVGSAARCPARFQPPFLLAGRKPRDGPADFTEIPPDASSSPPPTKTALLQWEYVIERFLCQKT
ncbi:hypothetical protein Daud_0964 [Candidatus Desulforudis audaxviator MP104C]|uniref:Uncharacterized protein n=1 Tax=Desulforudis audaxviator (strain MP104C) TaxID=477974 RepID=B1I3F4_DESAP|nr:hypothetical protein Daud_0964 [Candidatus Desulforudis audaxviator MP104C]